MPLALAGGAPGAPAARAPRARPPLGGRGCVGDRPPCRPSRGTSACAALAVGAAAAGALRRGRRALAPPPRPGGRGAGAGPSAARRAAVAEAQAPPAAEEPTPFPEDVLFREPMLLFLELLKEDPLDEEALIACMLDMEELHEFDRQWVEWPFSLGDVKRTPYNRGCFQALCGILRLVEHGQGQVQGVAIDLLWKLVDEGVTLTRLPVGLVVEMGAGGLLCSLARRTADEVVLKILRKLITDASPTTWPSLIKGGVITAAVDALNLEDITPMEQLAALDVLIAIAKRSPARAVEEGVHEAVLAIDNEGLVPRRNRILNLLRPMVRLEGEEDGQRLPTTNLRAGGLRY